jgi:formate-dependent nitrite reductase cytochrome c552 subunit
MVSISCTKEGPTGPAGADGKDGVDGVNGVDGVDGQDGTATCAECHDDSQTIMAKVMQWEGSFHATGGDYNRNTTACAPCHTSQGFLERMAAGTQETAETIENPLPQNCYTCHNIHSTYTAEDLGLTYADPVDYWFNPNGDATPDFGSGNLCANCHQMRVTEPWPVVGSSDIYTATSYRYGPHHGPMSQLLGGFGGYEVPGSLTYTNSPHTNVPEACVTCHLGVYNAGDNTGGHNMGANIADNCVSCHPDGIENETEEMQEEIHALLEELHYKLIDIAVADSAGYLLGEDGINRASSSNPANLEADKLGAFFNFKFIEEDRSGGVHNYKYAKALLTNSLEAL